MEKQFVVATLIAVVLLTVAFIPLSSQVGTYNPWLDTNDDGKMDGKDIAAVASAFGTKGDPTKNVTITGHATKVIVAANDVIVNASGINTWFSGWVTVDGYSKVTINIYFTTNANDYALDAMDSAGGSNSFIADAVTNFNYNLVKTYDVMNQRIQVRFRNNSGIGWAHLWVDIYLMA